MLGGLASKILVMEKISTDANPYRDLNADLDGSPNKSRKVSLSARGGVLSRATRSLSVGGVTLSAFNGSPSLGLPVSRVRPG
jgi:hypothetical protein